MITRPVMVDVGVNTDKVPVVAVVQPRGVGRGAAVSRILAAMAHDRESHRGRLGAFD